MIAALAVAAILVIGTIFLHFVVLKTLAARLNDEVRMFKRPLLVVLFALFCVHLVEVMLYAFGFYAMQEFGFGEIAIQGSEAPLLMADYFYFSITCYTTLGVGDIVPVGPTRIVSGIEALNGLVLIAWSASFTYWMMERLWTDDL